MPEKQPNSFLRSINNFLIVPIIPRFKHEFRKSTFAINLNRMIRLLYLSLLSLIAVAVVMLADRKDVNPKVIGYGPWLILLMAVLVLLVLVICYAIRGRLRRGRGKKLYRLEGLGSTFFLLLGLVLAYVEMQQAGNVGSYYLMLILATTAFYIKPLVLMAILIPAHAALIAMMLLLSNAGDPMNINIINTSICAGCLFIVSRVIYLGRVRGFVNRREIVRKNQRLQQVNRQLLESNENLQELYHTDQLTGIANRQQLYAYINQVLASVEGQSAVFGVWIMDIDYFKAYNDSFGHLAGDACLIWVAKELQRMAARHDAFVARYGGEEFVMLRFPCNETQLCAIGEELRVSIENKRWEHSGSHSGIVTISVGGAIEAVSMQDALAGRFIARADEAVYTAKKRGRNMFVMAQNIYC